MEYIYGLISYCFLTYLYEGFGVHNGVWKYKDNLKMILSFIGLGLIYGGVLLLIYLLDEYLFVFAFTSGIILLIGAFIHGACGTLVDFHGNWFEKLNLSKKEDLILYLARSTPSILILFVNNYIGFVLTIMIILIFSIAFIFWSQKRKESVSDH
ncbi:MAG: hypothetical protein ACTSVE_12030 [Candidatus Helarchaeota archaeon]